VAPTWGTLLACHSIQFSRFRHSGGLRYGLPSPLSTSTFEPLRTDSACLAQENAPALTEAPLETSCVTYVTQTTSTRLPPRERSVSRLRSNSVHVHGPSRGANQDSTRHWGAQQRFRSNLRRAVTGARTCAFPPARHVPRPPRATPRTCPVRRSSHRPSRRPDRSDAGPRSPTRPTRAP
jgi:hypothetical protein